MPSAPGEGAAADRGATDGAVPDHGVAPGRAAPDRGATEVLQLVRDAWRPGTHVVRLPPVYSAIALVQAAAEHGPVLVVASTNGRASAGCLALRRRGARVALLPGDWALARAGTDIVIGARSAAWGPCPGLASVVVLDAHDEGLVQEQAPTWDAPAVAAERARRSGVPCLWVTPCPTLELLSAADEVHVASRSTERAGWPAWPSSTAAGPTRGQGFTPPNWSSCCATPAGGSSASSTARAGPCCWIAPPAERWPGASTAPQRCGLWVSP